MNRSSDGQCSAMVDNEPVPYEYRLGAQLSRVLGNVQKHFVEHCRRLLKRGLQDAEEHLREWATRNPDELRLGAVRRAYAERNNILKAFCDCLAQGFAVVVEAGEVAEPAGRKSMTSAGPKIDTRQLPLVLVQAAAQTRAADCRLLDMVAERLNYLLLGDDAIPSTTSPVEPIRVVQCFLMALSGRLDLPYKAEEVLFLKFRSQVLDELGACYTEMNTMLVDAQILPSLGVAEGEAAEQVIPRHFTRADIAELLPIQPQKRDVPLQEILSQLTLGWGQYPWVGQLDEVEREQTITLCAALFDEVLNDPKMPCAATAILGRLVLPYARFALCQNSEFLMQPVHPARKLLSSLQVLGCTLGDLDSAESRSTYHQMMRTVGEIGACHALSDDHFVQAYRNLLLSAN